MSALSGYLSFLSRRKSMSHLDRLQHKVKSKYIHEDGTVIRVPVGSISTLSRNTQGVRLMRVAEESKVVCVARAEAEEEQEEEPEDDGNLENAPENDEI
jgi:DNA gyrase/topoisomerase IV subunit A